MTTPNDPLPAPERTSGRNRRQSVGFRATSSKQSLDPAPVSRLRHIGAGASIFWAIVAASIAAVGYFPLFEAQSDGSTTSTAAWILITSCSIIGPAAALFAARLILQRRDRLAGLALVISVITPTYFAAALNIPALIFGVALLILPLANGKDARPERSLQGS